MEPATELLPLPQQGSAHDFFAFMHCNNQIFGLLIQHKPGCYCRTIIYLETHGYSMHKPFLAQMYAQSLHIHERAARQHQQ